MANRIFGRKQEGEKSDLGSYNALPLTLPTTLVDKNSRMASCIALSVFTAAGCNKGCCIWQCFWVRISGRLCGKTEG